MEYRANADDMWYNVRVVAEENGDVLRVKFCGFSEEYDMVLRGSELKSKRDIHNLSERFRPIFVQVQDSDCSKVFVGDIVCASIAFREDDVRFYDALVDGVFYFFFFYFFFSLSLGLLCFVIFWNGVWELLMAFMFLGFLRKVMGWNVCYEFLMMNAWKVNRDCCNVWFLKWGLEITFFFFDAFLGK